MVIDLAQRYVRALATGDAEQVVTDVSYGIPKYELTVWQRPYPAETEDPTPPVAPSA